MACADAALGDRRRAILAVAVALIVAACVWADTIGFGFVADARFLIADNRYLDSWRFLWPTLTHDYFWSSSGAAIPYWRPLTKLSWLVEAQWFNHSPRAFHAVEILWLEAGVAGVFALARRLKVEPLWAGAAAIVFALHPALVEPGCLLMAQSDVQLLACTLWATVAWHAWATGARPSWLLATAHVLVFALALASKESAVVLPLAWTMWAIAIDRRRAWTTLPAWLLAAIYLLLRHHLLHAPAAAQIDPLRIFTGMGAYVSGLLPFRVETGVHNISFAEAHAPMTIAVSALAWLALLGGAILAIRRRSANTLGLLLLGSASLLPVLVGPTPNVPGVSGKYALADRWLITAAACATIGLTILLSSLPRAGRRIGAAAIAIWLLGSLAVARTAHGYYRSDEMLLLLEELHYQETPPRFLTVEDRCRAIERRSARATLAGDVDALLELGRSAPPECPQSASARFNLLSALVRAHRYSDARPMVEPLLEHFDLDRRYHGPALYLGGVTLLHTGDPARAEQLLLRARDEGVADCALFARLAEAAAAQQHDAAAYRQQLERCLSRPRW